MSGEPLQEFAAGAHGLLDAVVDQKQQAVDMGGLVRECQAFENEQGLLVAAAVNQRPGIGDAQFRMRFTDIVRYFRQPAHHQARVAIFHQVINVQDQLCGGLIKVLGCKQVLQCFDRAIGGEIPLCCLEVQLCRCVGLLLRQRMLEELGEQVVIAKPQSFFIRGDNEQVGTLQGLDHRLAVAAVTDGIAQGGAKLWQHTGLQQELAVGLGLPGEHVFGKVLGQCRVGAAERFNERGRVAVPLQGQRGQENPGYPAFGALVQFGGVIAAKGQFAVLADVLGGFIQA
ncbi:hypothetical protein D3C76_358250 [compost metagenome]